MCRPPNDYLTGPHTCHSQYDYHFNYPSDSPNSYTGKEMDGCFVYIIVKDNSKTKAVQLRIKGQDENIASVRNLFDQHRDAMFNMLNQMQLNANDNEDTRHAIINITINFTNDDSKNRAMVGLAEAWLAATGRLR